MPSKKFFKVLEIIFYIVVVVLLIGQTSELLKKGVNRETLVIVSEFLLIAMFLVVYSLTKNKTKQPKRRFLALRFILIGYLSTVLAEIFYIFSKPLHKDLVIDLVLVAPWYILWMTAWFFVLKKYKFSTKEAFYLGGFHGFVIEGLLAGLLIFNPVLALVSLPLLTFLYGCFFIIPYLITKEEFTNQKEVSLKKKIWLSLIPLLMYIPGFIWIAALTKILNLTLH